MTAKKIAELAELRRLHAAAKMPDRLYAITRPREAWEGINVYEVDTGGEQHWFALCLTRERAEYTEAALNAFPALIAELEAATAERDELAERMTDLQNERDAAMYAIELDGHATDYGKDLLADRDARMKAEGAAEALEKEAGEIGRALIKGIADAVDYKPNGLVVRVAENCCEYLRAKAAELRRKAGE